MLRSRGEGRLGRRDLVPWLPKRIGIRVIDPNLEIPLWISSREGNSEHELLGIRVFGRAHGGLLPVRKVLDVLPELFLGGELDSAVRSQREIGVHPSLEVVGRLRASPPVYDGDAPRGAQGGGQGIVLARGIGVAGVEHVQRGEFPYLLALEISNVCEAEGRGGWGKGSKREGGRGQACGGMEAASRSVTLGLLTILRLPKQHVVRWNSRNLFRLPSLNVVFDAVLIGHCAPDVDE